MISNGEQLLYTGSWVVPSGMTSGDVVSKVASNLHSSGLSVTAASPNTPDFWGVFDINMQILVENGLGFAQASDVNSIIRHAVYVVTGIFPTADVVSQIQASTSPSSGIGVSWSNIWSGTVTQDQKNQLIQQEHDQLVQAGMDDATAWAQAQKDVTGALVYNGADPSQDHSSTYLGVAIAFVGVFAVAYLVRSFK